MITSGYCTLIEFREFVGETADNNDHDSNFEQAIEAASRAVDNYCGVPPGRFLLASAASARTYYARGAYTLTIDPIGDTSGVIVMTGPGDGTFTTAVTGYVLEPLNAIADGEAVTSIRLSGGSTWPTSVYGTPQVEVTARWGWPTVPAPVKQATLQAAGELWFRRNAPAGFVQTVEFGPIRLSKDAMASVSALLNDYQAGTRAVALA